MAGDVDTKEEFYELLAFMTVSAIGCIKEPPIYGSLRLVSAMEKLIEVISNSKLFELNELTEIVNLISENKHYALHDQQLFQESLEEIAKQLISIMK